MVISVQIYVELFKFVAHFIRQISPPINATQIITEINVDLLALLGNLYMRHVAGVFCVFFSLNRCRLVRMRITYTQKILLIKYICNLIRLVLALVANSILRCREVFFSAVIHFMRHYKIVDFIIARMRANAIY